MMGEIGTGGSITTKNVFYKKDTILWAIRDTPTNELDNGWKFFSESDTTEYLKDTSNMLVCAWATMLEIEPALTKIFNLPIGTELNLIRKYHQIMFWDTKAKNIWRDISSK